MTAFATIREEAEKRAGGREALEARLPSPKPAAALRALADDRYFSMMTLRIFQAGLKHAMVAAKWPAFETAFHGFDPRRVRAMNDEDLDRLLGDKSLIRHGGKMTATLRNAGAFCALIEEKGSFGDYLADWPGAETVALWQDLARRFSQLGGNSGPRFLRAAGKDTFVLTPDVLRALERWAGLTGKPTSKRGQAEAQAQFNAWAEESGLALCQISMILAIAAG